MENNNDSNAKNDDGDNNNNNNNNNQRNNENSSSELSAISSSEDSAAAPTTARTEEVVRGQPLPEFARSPRSAQQQQQQQPPAAMLQQRQQSSSMGTPRAPSPLSLQRGHHSPLSTMQPPRMEFSSLNLHQQQLPQPQSIPTTSGGPTIPSQHHQQPPQHFHQQPAQHQQQQQQNFQQQQQHFQHHQQQHQNFQQHLQQQQNFQQPQQQQQNFQQPQQQQQNFQQLQQQQLNFQQPQQQQQNFQQPQQQQQNFQQPQQQQQQGFPQQRQYPPFRTASQPPFQQTCPAAVVPHHHHHHYQQQQQQQQSRQGSQTTLRSQISALPGERLRVVEVPMVQEVVRHVPAQPGMHQSGAPRGPRIVERVVDVPVQHEIVKTVPVKKVVEVPREILEPIHSVETHTIDQEIEVLGEVVQVPKPFLIENRVLVPRFVDFKVPTVVSQTLRPTFVESAEHAVEVRLREYVPELVPVSVFIPRPIERSLVIAGESRCKHAMTDVPLAQYNALVRELNKDRTAVLTAHPHIREAYLRFQRQADMENQKLDAVTDTSDADASSATTASVDNRVVTFMAHVKGELTELTTPSEAKAIDFWSEQMLVAAADGSIPALPEVQEIVFPETDDWKSLPARSGITTA